jgi:hypothetical protein
VRVGRGIDGWGSGGGALLGCVLGFALGRGLAEVGRGVAAPGLVRPAWVRGVAVGVVPAARVPVLPAAVGRTDGGRSPDPVAAGPAEPGDAGAVDAAPGAAGPDEAPDAPDPVEPVEPAGEAAADPDRGTATATVTAPVAASASAVVPAVAASTRRTPRSRRRRAADPLTGPERSPMPLGIGDGGDEFKPTAATPYRHAGGCRDIGSRSAPSNGGGAVGGGRP